MLNAATKGPKNLVQVNDRRTKREHLARQHVFTCCNAVSYGDLPVQANRKHVPPHAGWTYDGKPSGLKDEQTGKLGATSLGISRDLHCWVMAFDAVPFGRFRRYRDELLARFGGPLTDKR